MGQSDQEDDLALVSRALGGLPIINHVLDRPAPAAPVWLSSGSYKVVLTDVSGASWTTTARVS